MIKLFLGKLVKSKVGGLVSSLFVGWRLYALIAVVFGGYVLTLKYSIVKAQRERDNSIKKLDIRNQELVSCQDANVIAIKRVDEAIIIANECASRWAQIKEQNAQAIKRIKEQEQTHAEEINRIKRIKPVSYCDSQLLNTDDADWLRGKKANN